MQSIIIARAAQKRRVRSVRSVADHVHRQWTRRTAPPTAQEQQRGVRPGGLRRRREVQMGSTGHVVRQPGGHV